MHAYVIIFQSSLVRVFFFFFFVPLLSSYLFPFFESVVWSSAFDAAYLTGDVIPSLRLSTNSLDSHHLHHHPCPRSRHAGTQARRQVGYMGK